MFIMETTPFSSSNLPVFSIDKSMEQSLIYAAKWARFLAVVGFIGIGLTILASIFCGLFMDRFIADNLPGVSTNTYPTAALSIIYIIVGVLYFFPCLYLIRFGTRIRRAFKDNDAENLEHAFENLHFFYRFIGILMIIWLIIGALIIVGILIGFGMGYNLNRY